MKSNRIPRIVRLHNMLRKLILKQSNDWICEAFYPECRHCGITSIRFNMNGDHHNGCPHRGLGKQIKHWQGLISEEEKSETARRLYALAIFDVVCLD
jgi:hypothetical protein